MSQTETHTLTEYRPLPDGWELIERDGYRQLVNTGALEDTGLGWPRDDTDARINVASGSAAVENPAKLALTRTHQSDPLAAAVDLAREVEEAIADG